MTTTRLRIYAPDSDDTFALVERTNGDIRVVHAKPGIRRDLETILARGLVVWVDGPATPRQVVTPVASPDFLAKLGQYFRSQARLAYELRSGDVATASTTRGTSKSQVHFTSSAPSRHSRLFSVSPNA